MDPFSWSMPWIMFPKVHWRHFKDIKSRFRGSGNPILCRRWQYLVPFKLKFVISVLICMHNSLWTHFYDWYMFFYKHSVFQSEAGICLSFSQIQPQNMLKIAYLRKFKRVNFMVWPTLEGSELVMGIKMNKILKFLPSRLLKSLT